MMQICDCCKEEVHAIDEDALCLSCGMIQDFVMIIEEATQIDGDTAVDLACALVEAAKGSILQRSEDMSDVAHTKFFADVAKGMVRTEKGN